MIVYAVFDVAKILNLVPDNPDKNSKHVFCNYRVNTGSLRLTSFKYAQTCVCCGKVGNKMVLESNRHDEKPHFNMYANWNGYSSSGRDGATLMTKDHIIPKSCGGNDSSSNIQTMCEKCNVIKGSHKIDVNTLRKAIGVYNLAKSLNKKKPYVIVNTFLQLVK